MKAGDIVFVRGTSIISKIVRFFDGEWSHVAIAISDSKIVEADFATRVRAVDMTYTDYEIVDLNLTPEQRAKAKIVSVGMIGKWYDYIWIVRYLFRSIFKLKRRHRFNSPNRMICSHLVAKVLYQIGIAKNEELLKDATPNELYMFVKALEQDAL